MLSLIFVLLVVFVYFYAKTNLSSKKMMTKEEISLEKGQLFEKKIIDLIKSVFPNARILNGVIIPNGMRGGTTEIDIIALTSKGFFCIECKNYSGEIYRTKKSDKWIAKYGKNKCEFYSPVEQNSRHITCLRAKNMFPKQYFQNIVVFSDEATLYDNVANLENVFQPETLEKFLLEVKNSDNTVFDESPAVIDSIYSYLKDYENKNRKAHINYVSKIS